MVFSMLFKRCSMIKWTIYRQFRGSIKAAVWARKQILGIRWVSWWASEEDKWILAFIKRIFENDESNAKFNLIFLLN